MSILPDVFKTLLFNWLYSLDQKTLIKWLNKMQINLNEILTTKLHCNERRRNSKQNTQPKLRLRGEKQHG